MVEVNGVKLKITSELQQLLLKNPPKSVKKAIISKIRDDKGDLVQKKDEDGNPMFVNATQGGINKVYFDSFGNYYLRVFRSAIIDGKEVLITNPNIKTDPNCNLYGKGLISHRKPIPGSELWDNGRSDLTAHSEVVCKGDPLTKIIKTMTREEVLEIDLKPSGDSIVAKIANSSEAEKAVMLEQLIGKEKAQKLLED